MVTVRAPGVITRSSARVASNREALPTGPAMRLNRLPLLLALAALFALALSGPGVRLGLWPFPTGFQIMRWAAFGGLAAAVLALVVLLWPRLRRQGLVAGGLALALGLVTAWIPWQGLQTARSVPPIHDISTDLDEPPGWVALRAAREAAPNGAAHAGEAVAGPQREAYPDIVPIRLGVEPGVAFDRALAAARAMRWEIVAAERGEGRIEATATTFWYGFKDDVSIRVRAGDGGSRVDVRSMSRVGGSDVGANAARIRAFRERLGAD